MSTTVLIRVLLLIYFLSKYCHAEESCPADGDVRLVGGPNEFEGLVEVYIGGVWSRWCMSGGGVNSIGITANAICNQLYNTTGAAIRNSLSDSSTSFVSVVCSGNKSRLTDCTYDNTKVTQCDADVGLSCRDPACPRSGVGGVRLVNNVTESEGRVEICTNGFRGGLCCDELFDLQTATVLCRELGLSTNNPGFGTDIAGYRHSLANYNCSGTEQVFKECRPSGAEGVVCARVRLNCTDSSAPVENCSAQCPDPSGPDPTTITSNNSSAPVENRSAQCPGPDPTTITSNSSPIPIIVGVICGALAILLVCLVVILIVILLLRRKKTGTIEKDGITNINYQMTSTPQEKPNRTVHNSLYTQTEIPATSPNNAPYESIGPPVAEYATLEESQSGIRQSPLVPQHTLLHSTMSSDGGTGGGDGDGSHVYNKPTTPVSNNKSGHETFLDASGYSELEVDQSYSKLNEVQVNRSLQLDQSQGNCDVNEDQYSHIDDQHKYSKLSEQNSKGYSQLGIQTSTEEGSSAMPYEIPTTPEAAHEEGGVNPYSTVEPPEVRDTRYAKLHVFGEEGSRQPRQDNSADSTNDYNKLHQII